jgi:hypothetical protein
MTDTSQTRAKVAWRIWIAIRFIVFGIGGFFAVCASWFSLVSTAMDPPNERWLNPFVAVLLGLAGALMMLYGGGQWGRWAYLWVFVSVPIAVTPIGMLAQTYPQFDTLFSKPVFIVLIALPMPLSYLLVRRYYRQRELRALRQ